MKSYKIGLQTGYYFVVRGNPIPKARARVVNGHAFTPDTTRAWENTVKQAYSGPKFTGHIYIEMTFYRKNKVKADYDNLAKAVTDALNGIAYADDSQIVDARIIKRTLPSDPCVEVWIGPSAE